MAIDTTRRWFQTPGDSRPGERTLEEQMIGVWPAVRECAGKTVLDLGCAEGLIALEFAKAGAAQVTALESVGYHMEIARKFLEPYGAMFVAARIEDTAELKEHDIVLALAIVHKLHDMEENLRRTARWCKDLYVFRGPNYMTADGAMRSKSGLQSVNVPAVMKDEGFRLEAVQAGPRGEPVYRWRRD